MIEFLALSVYSGYKLFIKYVILSRAYLKKYLPQVEKKNI